MTDNSPNESAADGVGRGWRTLAWIVFGVICGAALVLLFMAYGQPALLLEQMNLRYCG